MKRKVIDSLNEAVSRNFPTFFFGFSVRAVVVASPTYTHEDIVIKSLENEKAVFCEKPIAGTIEITRKCFEKAREVGQPLLSAFNR